MKQEQAVGEEQKKRPNRVYSAKEKAQAVLALWSGRRNPAALMKELEGRLAARDLNLEWADVLRDLEALRVTRLVSGAATCDLRSAPQGVAGRNSDNTFIKKVLKWEPGTTLNKGLAETYEWIYGQYTKRALGQRVGVG